MGQITPQVIDRWLGCIKSRDYLGVQHSTRLSYRHELSVLRQVFRYYREYLYDEYKSPLRERHLEDSIVDMVRYKESRSRNKNRYLSQQEIERFLEVFIGRVERKPSLRVYALIALFQIRTGLRIGEACALSWKNVDVDQGVITVSQTVQWSRNKERKTQIIDLTKTGESRRIQICPQAVQALRAWRAESGRAHGIVFSQTGFEPLEYRCIQDQYNRAFGEAGIEWRSTHILRHSFATDFLTRTRNPMALKEILGHQNMRQTEHYAKIVGSVISEAVQAYEASLSGSKVVSLGFIREAQSGVDDGGRLVKAGNLEGLEVARVEKAR